MTWDDILTAAPQPIRSPDTTAIGDLDGEMALQRANAGWLPPPALPQTPVRVDYSLVSRVQNTVNQAITAEQKNANGLMSAEATRALAMALIAGELDRLSLNAASDGQPLMTREMERAVRDAVMAAMFGLGRIEALLVDPDIEDIYIRGTEEVIVKYAGGRREIREPVADSIDALMQQLTQIATHHGQNARSVSSAKPWLNLRLPGHARLAAVWGITPEPIITIRRHRYVEVTLEDLVELGTLSPAMAAFLKAAVLAKRSILVVGGQGSGKTTLLRGLAQCLPRHERFATLETEYELLLHEIPGRFPEMSPYEAREGMGEIGPHGRPAGEVTLHDIFPGSLRHSLDRYLLGEVREAEVVPLMQAMSRGARGSMATFHADSAVDTFDSLASLLSEYKINWSRDAAMQQIATAINLIVFIDREDTDFGEVRFVSEIMEVSKVGLNGYPSQNYIFKPDPEKEEFDPRGYFSGLPADKKWARRVRLDLNWLKGANSGWKTAFPPRWNGTDTQDHPAGLSGADQ